MQHGEYSIERNRDPSSICCQSCFCVNFSGAACDVLELKGFRGKVDGLRVSGWKNRRVCYVQ